MGLKTKNIDDNDIRLLIFERCLNSNKKLNYSKYQRRCIREYDYFVAAVEYVTVYDRDSWIKS